MRIQDNVAYGLKAMHLSKQETRSRSQKLLEFVELNEYAKHYPHQLSGGQKQRASLARSLATEPRVILLDEPVSAVDPEMKEPFRLELKSYLRKLEITTLYVTHNLSEAVVMSDRIAVMGNGHVEQIGCGHELFDKPTSNYVATFLGINAFKGKAVRSKGRLMEIRVNGTTLNATLEQSLIGKEIVATVKPESISLSKTQNEFSEESGINVMEGTIIEMTQMRSNAQITIDIGFTLKTRVPLSGVKALEIGIGENVYVNFEAKALNVFEDDHST
jgi:ABC-type Fe3+/spermidine/putrescine transport system ATPase subunit